MSTTKTSPRLLLSIAIGDAYGAGFEFETPEVVERENDGKHYRKRAGFTPGHYTDDTQMTLTIWEAVRLGEPWEPRYLADRFVNVYHRDPRPGYARGFEGVLKECHNGTDLLKKLKPESDRNGAAMRSVPLGSLSSITKVKSYAKIQAAITHNTQGHVDREAVLHIGAEHARVGWGAVVLGPDKMFLLGGATTALLSLSVLVGAPSLRQLD